MKRESKNKRKIKECVPRLPYGTIGKVILGAAAVSGFMLVAAAAPNVFQAFGKLEKIYRRNYRQYRSPKIVRQEIEKLATKKLILIFEKNGEQAIRLTDKGRRELLRYQLKEKRLEQKTWDKKWRLVIFDIEEKRRYARDRVRQEMQSFGFEKLQDSVWVYPHECEQAIALLKAQYKIGKELVYIVARDIENDGWLRKKFDLL